MAGRRISAGYYRRYDGKVVYVVSLATDADTDEEMVVWTTYTPLRLSPDTTPPAKNPSVLLWK